MELRVLRSTTKARCTTAHKSQERTKRDQESRRAHHPQSQVYELHHQPTNQDGEPRPPRHSAPAHSRQGQIGTLAERLEASRGSSLNTPPNKLHHQHLQRSFTRYQAALPVFRPLAACSAHLDGYSHHELTKRPACSVSAPVGTA